MNRTGPIAHPSDKGLSSRPERVHSAVHVDSMAFQRDAAEIRDLSLTFVIAPV